MGAMKTPGVYVVEKNAFPNSVVEVATAVPAFIGHTAMANNHGRSLTNKPWRICSMSEFQQFFGGGPSPRFRIEEIGPTEPAIRPGKPDFTLGAVGYEIDQIPGKEGGSYLFHRSLCHFFQNGGGPCYIVSVGDYSQDLDLNAFKAGVDALVKEQEPTLLVIPEAVLFTQSECIELQQAMLTHCGGTMKNRMAILDIWGGDKERTDFSGDPVNAFRKALGQDFVSFGAAYYPWLHTTMMGDKNLNHELVENLTLLKALLRIDLGLSDEKPDTTETRLLELWQALEDLETTGSALRSSGEAQILPQHPAKLHQTLLNASHLYITILGVIKHKLNVLPPSAAMAGVYTMVDNTRGVWKAPANVSLNGVVTPAVPLSAEDQEDLSVSAQGQSINAIRSFVGEGVLVWGARTLDGNSLDWRYINVRRTMIMLEESCRLAARAMVFEPNVATTWSSIRTMTEAFLTNIWKRGGLAGAGPEDAFSVQVGLGETMTAEDILEGILRVTVRVALSRPAEFIEITFQQPMQKN